MSQCRFEDRLCTARAGPDGAAAAALWQLSPKSCLQPSLGSKRRAVTGHWVALLLEYELGEWLEPALSQSRGRTDNLLPGGAERSPKTHRTRLCSTCTKSGRGQSARNATSDTQASILSDYTRALPGSATLRAFSRIREWIAQGEVYQSQLNLPSVTVKTQGDPAQLYRQIATRHPVCACGVYSRTSARTILVVFTRAFYTTNGYHPHHAPHERDCAPMPPDPVTWIRRLGEALHTSEKNRAENLMIVDLLRNDLGRLARPGSVRADPLFSLEKYPSVWTMTSTVQAEIVTRDHVCRDTESTSSPAGPSPAHRKSPR